MDLPIACSLTESELKERRRLLFDSIRGTAVDVTALDGGYTYTFQPTPEVFLQIARLVDLERQCCQFLTFKLVAEAGGAPVRLEVTGPPGASAAIADFFGGA